MPVDISIIVPVFNEADNVLPLAREVAAAMKTQPRSFEWAHPGTAPDFSLSPRGTSGERAGERGVPAL